MIIYDAKRGGLVAARDPIGIRPLYYGYDADGGDRLCQRGEKPRRPRARMIMPFPPGHYYADGKFICYRDMTQVDAVCHDDLETVCANIRDKLIAGVEKRLDADAPLGFLLSGGLDSLASCAPSPREAAAKSPSAPLPSACVPMPSTSSTPARWRIYRHATTPRSSSRREDVIQALPEVVVAARHLRHHDHPREHRHVPCLQGHPRADRPARAADGRDLR